MKPNIIGVSGTNLTRAALLKRDQLSKDVRSAVPTNQPVAPSVQSVIGIASEGRTLEAVEFLAQRPVLLGGLIFAVWYFGNFARRLHKAIRRSAN
jgi:hypothetical protein